MTFSETMHVLGDIKERTYEKNILFTVPVSTIEKGFPEAFVRDKIVSREFTHSHSPLSHTQRYICCSSSIFGFNC